MGKVIRVLIVDDHAVVRSGLAAFLLSYEDLELIGEAGSGKEAIELCTQLKPDVVLMDMVMPGMHGSEATEAIKKECPNIQVIALTSFPEADLVQQALKAGAISYMLKNVSGDELADAIRGAYNGESTLSPEATKALVNTTRAPKTPGWDLTSRELDVLELMVKGLSNKELSDKLIVSNSTVKFHVSNIISKLGVTSRTEAVSVAFRYNLVK